MAKATIELAYNFLKEKKGHSTFEEIWNHISKELHDSNTRKNEIIAELYTDLVLDNRFALTADGDWAIRDELKLEDVKKQYSYIDSFETTEEFDDMDATMMFDDADLTDDTNDKAPKPKKDFASYDDDNIYDDDEEEDDYDDDDEDDDEDYDYDDDDDKDEDFDD